MVKRKLNFNNKKSAIAVTNIAIAILLVASIAAIGAAPFSYQQQQQPASDRQGLRITSANIVDGEVKNQDLAPNSVTSDKIKDGEVKAEDLDPSIQIGGGETSPGFSLQTTERSKTIPITDSGALPAIFSVQCNSDEVVTGGGYSSSQPIGYATYLSKRLDNGWSVSWSDLSGIGEFSVTVYAECLKLVNNGGTATG